MLHLAFRRAVLYASFAGRSGLQSRLITSTSPGRHRPPQVKGCNMGMFDEIVCDFPLPGSPPAFIRPGHVFQTKSLDCEMVNYRIAADGTFSMPDYTGTIEFDTSNFVASVGEFTFTRDGEDYERVDYRAIIASGRLTGIWEIDRERKNALPLSLIHEVEAAERARTTPGRRIDADTVCPIGSRVYIMGGGDTVGHWARITAQSGSAVSIQVEGCGDLEIHDLRLGQVFTDEESALAARRDRDERRERTRARYAAALEERKMKCQSTTAS